MDVQEWRQHSTLGPASALTHQHLGILLFRLFFVEKVSPSCRRAFELGRGTRVLLRTGVGRRSMDGDDLVERRLHTDCALIGMYWRVQSQSFRSNPCHVDDGDNMPTMMKG